MFFLLSSVFFCIDIIGMQQENKLTLVPDDVLYKITHDCSLQSIGRLKQTCKEHSNDDIDSRYYAGRLMCGLGKNSSEAMVELKHSKNNIQCRKLLKYFAKKNDTVMFCFCQLLPKAYMISSDGLFLDATSEKNHDIDVANFLVMQKQIYLNSSWPAGTSENRCLYLACAYGRIALVKKMIWYGANVNYTSNYTSLHFTCMNGNVELAKYLIDNGADVNIVDVEGNSSLDIMKTKPEFKELIDSLPFLEKNFRVIRNIAMPLALVVGGVGFIFYAKISK